MNQYIGIPFDELNCYQLFREIYKNEQGIELPNPNIRYDESYKAFVVWQNEVSKNWVRCEPKKGAGVALKYNMEHPKIVTHFGYCVDDKHFIHTLKETGAIMEEIRKYENIIEGFYAYEPNNNAQ